MNARLSAGDPDWYTPAAIMEAVREVLGDIDLDPASDAVANQWIGARRIYTIADNGLTQPWLSSTIFLNPPGGQVAAFWDKLVTTYNSGLVGQAIWVGFSLEQLQSLQRQATTNFTPLDFPLCVPRSRIAFVENEAKRVQRRKNFDAENDRRLSDGVHPKIWKEKSGPTHANYITYLGPRAGAVRFARVFGEIGVVRR